MRTLLELTLVCLTLGILGAVLLARGVPMTGHRLFVVGGGSMEPSIHLGSAVFVEPVPATSLAVGDVVTIEVGPEHAIFTHRITRLVDRPDGLWIETKGDANETPDPSIIPATAVLGRVQLTVPGLGYVVAALSQPSGVGAALGLAGLLVALLLLLEGGDPAEARVSRPITPAEPRAVVLPPLPAPTAPQDAPPPTRRRLVPRSTGSVGGG
ncbi:MAG: signal peptidase I [Chloroflexi bacterium]|nr:signal peptidase I [Chloroflexota bacterium]